MGRGGGHQHPVPPASYPPVHHIHVYMHACLYTCTVTAGEDGLTTIVRATLSTANDIMTVSPYPYTPPLTSVPAADRLLGGGHTDWPCTEQCL